MWNAAPTACEIEWQMPSPAFVNASPARYEAIIIFSRAASSSPFLYASGSHSNASLSAFSAYASVIGFAPYASNACVMTSIPVKAVTLGGTVFVSL